MNRKVKKREEILQHFVEAHGVIKAKSKFNNKQLTLHGGNVFCARVLGLQKPHNAVVVYFNTLRWLVCLPSYCATRSSFQV